MRNLFFFSFLLVQNTFAASTTNTKSLLLVNGGTESANAGTGVTLQGNFLNTIQSYLLGAYILIAIGVLLYIGFKLFTAHGNEEEFKKAWIALVYIVIGLAIPPLSYVAVKIVTGLTL